MIKVTRSVPVDVPVIIELDAAAARELLNWLKNADTPRDVPFELWDTLDDVLREGKVESVRP